MPKSRKAKPRRYRRRRSKLLPHTSITRGATGFPDQMMVKLKYVEAIQLTSTVGAYVSTTFQGNSLFDPNLSGGGHQPMNFDQWKDFYVTNLVFGCKITVTYSNTSSVPVWVAILQKQSDASSVSISQATERNRVKKTILGQSNGGAGTKTISWYQSTKKALNIKHLSNSDHEYIALNTTLPPVGWYFQIAAQTLDLGTTSVVDALVELTYYVKFFNRVLAGPS